MPLAPSARFVAPFALLGALLSTGCEAPSASHLGQQRAPIIGGKLAPDVDNVVLVMNLQEGGMCSASIIADRVVLTAKHCVQPPKATEPSKPSQLRVGVGAKLAFGGGNTTWYGVADVVTTPGTYDEGLGISDLFGKDVAVITLTKSPGIPPIKMKLTSPEDEKGKHALAIGYGETPSGETGTKYQVDTTVVDVDDVSVEVDGTVCQGDSGGPLINDDKEIIGVVSVGMGMGCSGGASFYQRIDIYADLILGAIKKSGNCSNNGPEACDGFDNDCDDMVDEDCLDVGAACTRDADCLSNLCADTSAGKICTTSCDPISPAAACPKDFICAGNTACTGVCEPGKVGTKAFGEACQINNECASLFCADPGDGKRRCLSVCRGGASACLYDEACVAGEGQCGSCVSVDLVSGQQLGQDEACTADTGCRSGLCFDDGGSRYCTTACGADSDCDGKHHCRGGACVRGARGALGATCQDTDDCAGGFFCAKTEKGNFCTNACQDGQGCGDGFACKPVANGSACLPDSNVVGGPCKRNEDCVSGLCFTPAGVCTRLCDSPTACGAGLECARSSQGAPGLCLGHDNAKAVPQGTDTSSSGAGDGGAATDDSSDKKSSGCTIGYSAGFSSTLLVVWALSLLGLVRRRRSRG